MKAGKTSWGKVAKRYEGAFGSEDTYQARVILPNLLRLLEPLKGASVTDIACGSGFFARAFAAAGATVTGADVSPELVAEAKRAAPEVRFLAAPSHALPLPAASADAATIILAIQNIEKMDETFAECARVLKPGGKLLLVMNHPAFRIPERSDWGWDLSTPLGAGGTMYRRINGYLSDSRHRIVMNPSAKRPIHTVSFHRPLQGYMKALAKHGFAVTRLEEWTSDKQSTPGPRAAEEDRMRKEIPLFLFIEAKK